MSHVAKKFAVSAAVLAATATTGLFFAPLAQAGTMKPSCVVDPATDHCYLPPACTGNACWGQDPITTRCAADGEIVGIVTSYEGTLELFYSWACQSNWAQLVNHNPGAPAQFGVKNQANQAAVWALAGANSGSSGWTDMVSGIPLSYAWSEGSDGSDYVETGLH
jgi:hypothetical protein